jgi:hypothetical protein
MQKDKFHAKKTGTIEFRLQNGLRRRWMTGDNAKVISTLITSPVRAPLPMQVSGPAFRSDG